MQCDARAKLTPPQLQSQSGRPVGPSVSRPTSTPSFGRQILDVAYLGLSGTAAVLSTNAHLIRTHTHTHIRSTQPTQPQPQPQSHLIDTREEGVIYTYSTPSSKISNDIVVVVVARLASSIKKGIAYHSIAYRSIPSRRHIKHVLFIVIVILIMAIASP